MDDRALYIFSEDGNKLRTLFEGETSSFRFSCSRSLSVSKMRMCLYSRGLAHLDSHRKLLTTETTKNEVKIVAIEYNVKKDRDQE
jgi:hypothetical protein